MRDVVAVVEAHGGALLGTDAVRLSGRSAVQRELSRGLLLRPFPRVLVTANRARDADTLMRAALIHTGPIAALSHVSALLAHGLPVSHSPLPVHVTVSASRRLRGNRHLRVHRRSAFITAPGATTERYGLTVVSVERAIVESWPDLPEHERRAPAIVAVSEGRTTAQRLLEEVLTLPRLTGRAQVLALIDVLGTGCRSVLEIWGYRQVLDDPRLPEATWQYPVRLAGRWIFLDVAYRRVLVNVELDGARYHFGRVERERDMRRDAALARLGWVTLRFSHDRLHEQPAQVREELLAVVATRERQLRLPA